MRSLHLFVAFGVVCAASACGTKNPEEDGEIGPSNGSASDRRGDASGIGGSASVSVGGNASPGGSSSVGGNAGAGTGSDATNGGNNTVGGSPRGTGGAYFDPDECTQLSGVPVPVVLEFSIDNTMSMSETAPSTNNRPKWECAKDAFAAQIPNFPDDYAVGLTYYHVNSGPCNDATQAVAIDVVGAANSAQRQALSQSIATQRQIQMTPSKDAWQFATNYTLEWTAPGYEHARKHVIIMTDGVPTIGSACADSAHCAGPTETIGISEAQYQGYIDEVAVAYQQAGIQTFFIGVPGSENVNQVTCNDGSIMYDPRTKLSQLARAGGTAPAGCSDTGAPYCHVDLTDPSIDFQQALQAAIGTIMRSTNTCTYTAPDFTGSTKVVVIPAKTVVTLTTNEGVATAIERSEGCTDVNGWDFADSEKSIVQLCSTLCEAVKADSTVAVKVDFGCTVIG